MYLAALASALQDEAPGGPRLIVPEGFVAELVAEAPAVRWPSAVHCLDDGSLLVAEDPMDMVGPAHLPLDRILRLELAGGPAPSRSTVFAEGLYAVFGIESIGSRVFVANTPHLTLLEDADGDGVAERRELLVEGLGPVPPGVEGGFNDHVVSGLSLGLDGFLYVSVGDKGLPRARGRDGSEVTLRGGGVVRVRPDGTRLEVVATGSRNHLDVVLDERGAMFTFDNSDDGLGWWTRLAHVIEDGYYGYPFDYREHPERMLPCLADLGAGAPAGGLCYREAAWPLRFQGSFFWCEWGQGSVQRFELAREGATFRLERVEQFASPPAPLGGAGVSAGGLEFRPLDLCLSPDGVSMYVADWGHPGWQSDEVTGRVWRIRRSEGEHATPRRPAPPPKTPTTMEGWIDELGADGYAARRRAQQALVELGTAEVRERLALVLADNVVERRRRHALWALAELGGSKARAALVAALDYPNDDTRIQALRALGQDAGVLPAEAFELLEGGSPPVRREAAACIGRLGLAADAERLVSVLRHERDPWVRWSIRDALRRIGCWDERVLAWPRLTSDMQSDLLLALRGVYDVEAVASLAAFAGGTEGGWLEGWAERLAPARAQALELLADVHLQPEPWDGRWWSTQPARGAPPPKVLGWEGSAPIRSAIRSALGDPAHEVRRAALEALRATGDRGGLALVREQFARETRSELRRLALEVLGDLGDQDAVELLTRVARDPAADPGEQDLAVLTASRIATPAMHALLLEVVREDALSAETLAGATAALGAVGTDAARALLEERLAHPREELRAAALRGLAPLCGEELAPRLLAALGDESIPVRREAVRLAGELGLQALVPRLAELRGDAAVRGDVYRALERLPDARALDAYLEGLASVETRAACRAALGLLREELLASLEARYLSGELREPALGEVRSIYREPRALRDWSISGPYRRGGTLAFFDDGAFRAFRGIWSDPDLPQAPEAAVWRAHQAEPVHGRVDLALLLSPAADLEAWARGSFTLAQPGAVELAVGSDDAFSMWIDGRAVNAFDGRRGWAPDQERVALELEAGEHEIVLRIGQGSGDWAFSVALARSGGSVLFQDSGLSVDAARLAKYRKYALEQPGNLANGYRLFMDTRRLGCVRCHVLTTTTGRTGDAVGPDLDGIGERSSRAQLITSILEPSERIASGYAAVRVWTTDGRQLTGQILREDAAELVLVDPSGEQQVLAADEIAGRSALAASIMPEGFDALLAPEELTDLVTFLESLKGGGPDGDESFAPPSGAGRRGE